MKYTDNSLTWRAVNQEKLRSMVWEEEQRLEFKHDFINLLSAETSLTSSEILDEVEWFLEEYSPQINERIN